MGIGSIRLNALSTITGSCSGLPISALKNGEKTLQAVPNPRVMPIIRSGPSSTDPALTAPAASRRGDTLAT